MNEPLHKKGGVHTLNPLLMCLVSNSHELKGSEFKLLCNVPLV